MFSFDSGHFPGKIHKKFVLEDKRNKSFAGRWSLFRLSQKEAVLGGDFQRDRLGVDLVAAAAQAGNAGGIDGEGSIHPAAQAAALVIIEIMTAGEDGDAGPGIDSPVENEIGQSSAGMGRDDQIASKEGNCLDAGFDKSDLPGQARPLCLESGCQGAVTLREAPIDRQRCNRLTIEEEENLGEEAVPAGHIDDPSAPKATADAARHLPGFIEFFSRQTAGAADRAGDAVEEGFAGKEGEVAFVKAIAGGEVHGVRAHEKG